MLPITEQRNPKSEHIDSVSTLEAADIINSEDRLVAEAVEKVIPQIVEVVEATVERLRRGGRLFYTGTGTSGRLGVLDASEIPPTYGVSYELVQGVIAGGYDALYKATESSEDDREAGGRDLESRGLKHDDVVIGLAASGRTPYTIGALEFARRTGCFTACITCVGDSAITEAADVSIVPVVGPEVITGSTRMKSGTAQKLVLNMVSTLTMIKLGYVKGNRMTNVKSSNIKLRERSIRILMQETSLDETAAAALFADAEEDLRVAIVMHRAASDAESARAALEQSSHVIEKAVEKLCGR